MANVGRTELIPLGGLSPVGKGPGGLKVGDMVTATVLGISDRGEVLINVRGERVAARTETLLAPGDTLSLRVEDTGGTVVLKLMAREVPLSNRFGELLRSNPTLTEPLGGRFADLLASLRTLLAQAPGLKEGAPGQLLSRLLGLWPGEGASGSALKEFVENSGLFYEQRLYAALGKGDLKLLPDMKALIIEARHAAAEMASKSEDAPGWISRFVDSADRMLRNLEGMQLAAAVLAREEGAFCVSFPYGDTEHPEKVEWEVKAVDNEKKERHAFVLRLDMSGLGAVRVDGLLEGGALHCRFWGRDLDTAGFIEGHLEEFARSAVEHGMVVGSMGCQVGKREESFVQRAISAAGMRLYDRFA